MQKRGEDRGGGSRADETTSFVTTLLAVGSHYIALSDEQTKETSFQLASTSFAGPAAPSTVMQSGRHGHGRSISHPFPSIFGAGKKSERDGHKGRVLDAGDSTDDEIIADGEGPMPNSSPIRSGSHYRKAVDRETTSGRCMTCDSTVRWPKELTVFRCTICLTINDLQPKPPDGPDSRAPWSMAGETTTKATATPIATKGTESSASRSLVRLMIGADRSSSAAAVNRENTGDH